MTDLPDEIWATDQGMKFWLDYKPVGQWGHYIRADRDREIREGLADELRTDATVFYGEAGRMHISRELIYKLLAHLEASVKG